VVNPGTSVHFQLLINGLPGNLPEASAHLVPTTELRRVVASAGLWEYNRHHEVPHASTTRDRETRPRPGTGVRGAFSFG